MNLNLFSRLTRSSKGALADTQCTVPFDETTWEETVTSDLSALEREVPSAVLQERVFAYALTAPADLGRR